jgi:hypothetical protein
MGGAKKRVPAIEGWFRIEEPALLGTRCGACGTIFFPKETDFCRNPECSGTDFEEVPLSRRGRLWSFTDNHYAPPAPYIAPEPFEPYTIAAVELDDEKMVVLGQVERGVGVADLEAGMEMELTIATLYEDDEHEYVIWNWRPVAA